MVPFLLHLNNLIKDFFKLLTLQNLFTAFRFENKAMALTTSYTSHLDYVEKLMLFLNNLTFFFIFFQVLLTALRFNNKAVAQIASDMVLLLSDHVEKLLDFYPEVPKKIVEVLARTLTSLIPQVTHDLENDERRLLLSLLFCLGKFKVLILILGNL